VVMYEVVEEILHSFTCMMVWSAFFPQKYLQRCFCSCCCIPVLDNAVVTKSWKRIVAFDV